MESKPTICVAICERSISDLADALTAAAPMADVIELRLDCLDQAGINESLRPLNELVKNSSKPTILTFRPASQGGFHELSDDNRLSFWQVNRPGDNTFLDLELDLALNPASLDDGKTLDWTRVICSHHDFSGVPSDLESLYQQMANTPARILKIAVQANDAIDCLPIFQLLERAQRDRRELIAIAMGEAGLMTRILGPSRGSFLTYAARDHETTTASGQVSARWCLGSKVSSGAFGHTRWGRYQFACVAHRK